MGISVQPFGNLSPSDISDLQSKLVAYYSNRRDSYYEVLREVATQYSPEILPFHCDLVDRVERGATVLEVGCGSAHLCEFVQSRGGVYTGVDYSDELLEENRRKFPNGHFFKIGTEVGGPFDVVASLYTIEHVVDPPSYLESLWAYCKLGGLIAIICPDFVDGTGYPPSFFYGRTPRRFREKICSLAATDAAMHLIDMIWFAPKWRRRARASASGAFWINLEPRIFHGAEYSIDADAVHFPRLKDMVWWLERRGASIIETSRSMKNVPEMALRYNCYVIARRPVAT